MTKPAILDRRFQEAIDLCVPAIAKQLGLSKLEVACLYGLPETVTKIEGEARWTIVSKSNRDETYSVTEDHTNPEEVTATCDCQAGCKGLECVHINAWSLALNPSKWVYILESPRYAQALDAIGARLDKYKLGRAVA